MTRGSVVIQPFFMASLSVFILMVRVHCRVGSDLPVDTPRWVFFFFLEVRVHSHGGGE